ncbi:class I SAM-dependent rRNA methyltransferase [Bdellovibrio reynosensis]|uniref:Class I SAM-dependent rRNA methyltransferase n=1 Tax=Bdellovibrio reynosensis TaxID=2835041 RepID=A0ABY4CC60_9BACT|nr:class I SAM-dependent rRNA methyltransferase [Bdellovibrio reynosensis]UOF02557.1 class I SAM-dependent rRNA methyltransferase [Bdellovibrio reynosensis]
MNPAVTFDESVQTLELKRDVTKHLKQGHRWIFANCFEEGRSVKSGIHLLNYKGETLALGIWQNDTQLRFRVLVLAEEPIFRKNSVKRTLELYFENQWRKAVEIRRTFDLSVTNSFRLINGEGDGLPGLIVDIYNDTAVIKHDHAIMEKTWNAKAIGEKIQEAFPQIKCVYLKRRNDADEKGTNIIGTLAPEVQFLENGVLFASNIRDAAKTGFFLDQRDNRKMIQHFAKGKTVLNLFSYTGGFSIFAAKGGAKEVTSVDIAKVAIQAVQRNFEINKLNTVHHDVATDAFAYLEQLNTEKKKYDIVITDPPSFAPNEKSVEQAKAAYAKVFSNSIKLVNQEGLFAASSCSSHISTQAFMEICKEAFSKARKKGTLVYMGGQPVDHPYPLAMEELRYLKFALFRLD